MTNKPKYEVSIFESQSGWDAVLRCNCTQMGETMMLKESTFDLLLTAITTALTKHESE